MILSAGNSNGQRILAIAGVSYSLINFRGPLLKTLVSKGYNVHVAAPFLSEEEEDVQQTLATWGITCHKIPLQRAAINPAADLLLIFALYKLIRTIKPDRMLMYTIKPVIFGNLAAKLAGVSQRYSLITGLGYAFTEGSGKKRALIKRLVQTLYAEALKGSAHVFFQNRDDKSVFQQLGLLEGCQSVSIVNGSGVDIDRFVISPARQGHTEFLMIARLLGDKGVREFVYAATIVKQLHPDTNFTIIGYLDENPNSIKQVELDQWIKGGIIKFGGKLDDVRPAIEKSSVYVLPSYREGTPRTVLEAMAMGRPIITTDAPGCRETVDDGHNGFLVPVKSVEALADAMLKFINNPELISKMGQSSRKIAEEKYDVHKVNADMLIAMGITP